MWGSARKNTKKEGGSKRDSFEERFGLDTFDKGTGLDLASVLKCDDFEEYDIQPDRRATIGFDDGLPSTTTNDEDLRRKSFSLGIRALGDHNRPSSDIVTPTSAKKKHRRKSGSKLPGFLRRSTSGHSSRRSVSQPPLEKRKSKSITKAEALALAEAEVIQARALAQVKLKKLAELEQQFDDQEDKEPLNRTSSQDNYSLPNISEHEEASTFTLPTPTSPVDATLLSSDELIALIEEKTASANFGDEQAEAEIGHLCALLEKKTDL